MNKENNMDGIFFSDENTHEKREQIKPTRVCIVDDEEDHRDVVDDAVTSCDGFEMQKCATAEELFHDIETSGCVPKIIFVDGQIRGSTMDGVEIVDKLRKEYGDRVFICAYTSSDEIRKKMLEKGANRAFAKGDVNSICTFLKDKEKIKNIGYE